MKKIVLISCVSQKQTTPQKAKDLYTSALFVKSLIYAEKMKPNAIYILSAEHHLLSLEMKIAPYEKTLNKMTKKERTTWGEKVISELRKIADIQKDTFIILAGQKYIEPIEKHIKNLENPLEGKKIGERLQFLTENL